MLEEESYGREISENQKGKQTNKADRFAGVNFLDLFTFIYACALDPVPYFILSFLLR